MDDTRIAVRVDVTGRVQGVGYRAYTRRQARAQGVDGYVYNRTDGSVRAVLEGASSDVDAVIERMRTGPPGARVESLSVEPATPGNAGHSFNIRYI